MISTEPTTAAISSNTQSGASSEIKSEPIALLTEVAWGKGRRTKWEKAIRLLVQGRLRVYHVESHIVEAEVKGDSGVLYKVGWNAGKWYCSCPARVDCYHLMALQAVTAVSK